MEDTFPTKILPRSFYTRAVITVAKDLLGKVLIKDEGKNLLSGRIVEVETYDGRIDEAAHTFRGRTKRNEVMFNEGGYFYVYFTYGAHFCCNIVTGEKDHGAAVLVRAIEPLEGIELMIKRRFGRKLKNDREIFNLTSGPGKISQAFDFNIKHSGYNLTDSNIYLLDRPKLSIKRIGISKRIGITKSMDLPWRFYEKENPYLSR